MFCTTCEQPVQIGQNFCANCGNATDQNIFTTQTTVSHSEAEDVQNNPREIPITEIRLRKPLMIGNYILLSDIFWALFFLFFGYQTVNVFSDGIFYLLGWLVMFCGVVIFLGALSGTANVKKPCPYCREMNTFFVKASLHSCAYCQKEIKVKWVDYLKY